MHVRVVYYFLGTYFIHILAFFVGPISASVAPERRQGSLWYAKLPEELVKRAKSGTKALGFLTIGRICCTARRP